MPRKTSAKKSVDKDLVSTTFSEISTLLEDQVARTVADLVGESTIDRDKAARVTTVIQAVARECVSRVRSTKGL